MNTILQREKWDAAGDGETSLSRRQLWDARRKAVKVAKLIVEHETRTALGLPFTAPAPACAQEINWTRAINLSQEDLATQAKQLAAGFKPPIYEPAPF